MIEPFLQVILSNKLAVFPLYSIADGRCGCRDEHCSSPGKHPLFRSNWQTIATSEEAKIRGWFSRFNNLNYAVATGRVSSVTGKHLVVIDVDREDHPFAETLPKTLSYRTGKGRHFWFWSDRPVQNSVSRVADKVDIRGTGGYVVIPPSKHLSGKRYEFPEHTEVARLPLLTYQPKTTKRSRQVVKQAVDIAQTVIPVGQRNTVLHRLLSADRARGVLTKRELLALANGYMERFETAEGFEDEEMRRTVDSVMRYPAYNNSHQRVNEVYVKWLRKRGEVVDLATLESLDAEWFSMLRATDCGLPLETLGSMRRKFLESRGLRHISGYKPCLLGAKLREMGFERKRTARSNTWLVSVQGMV